MLNSFMYFISSLYPTNNNNMNITLRTGDFFFYKILFLSAAGNTLFFWFFVAEA